jgi:phosphohistidine phosphatase SixA
MRYPLFLILAISLIAGCRSDSNSNKNKTSGDVKTILLVRHAEKTNQSEDPPLSVSGRQRAIRLAKMLKAHPISAVYSTDFERTKSTAEPISAIHSLETQIYGTSDLTQLRSKLHTLETGEMAVVVGHSNTTPVVVKLLDEKSSFNLIDESDYENIFIVEIDQKGKVKSMKTTFDAFEAKILEGH